MDLTFSEASIGPDKLIRSVSNLMVPQAIQEKSPKEIQPPSPLFISRQ